MFIRCIDDINILLLIIKSFYYIKRNVVLPVICFLSILALSSCYSDTNFPSSTRSMPPQIPKYTNAQNWLEETRNGIANFQDKFITFETKDPAGDMFVFYQNSLRNRGWEMLSKEYFVNKEACPLYNLYISSKTVSDRNISVELRLIAEPCINR